MISMAMQQEPKNKAYVREYRIKIWPEIWYRTSILGSWNSRWWLVANHYKFLIQPVRQKFGECWWFQGGSYRCSTDVFVISMVPIAALRHVLAFPGGKNWADGSWMGGSFGSAGWTSQNACEEGSTWSRWWIYRPGSLAKCLQICTLHLTLW